MSETNLQLFPGIFRSTQGGANPDFFLHSSGRVGIGNEAPGDVVPPGSSAGTTFKLNVTGHANVSGTMQANKYYGDGSALSGVAAVIGGYWDLDESNDNISYSAGNVGIGGVAGTERLKVHGTVEATALSVGGTDISSTYATNTALTTGLATKQASGSYATSQQLTDGLATNQASGSYASLNGDSAQDFYADRLYSDDGARISGTEFTTDYDQLFKFAYTKVGEDSDPNNQDFGLYVEKSVRAAAFVAISDKRIKSNIVDINDTYALDQIRAIKPKYYEYIDKKSRGSSSVIGFIAQEIKEVIPRAVAVTDGQIPNIYSFANITASNVLTFTDFNTSTLDSNATTSLVAYVRGNTNIKLTISEIIDEHSIRIIENIPNLGCSFDENGNVITETSTTTLTVEEYNNLESKDGYLPTISGYEQANVIISVDEYNSLEDKTGYTNVIDNYTKTSTNYPGNEIFVWGQNVTDFHHINKDYIWTVATAALQEVDRQLQAEREKVASLEERLAALEAIVLNQ